MVLIQIRILAQTIVTHNQRNNHQDRRKSKENLSKRKEKLKRKAKELKRVFWAPRVRKVKIEEDDPKTALAKKVAVRWWWYCMP